MSFSFDIVLLDKVHQVRGDDGVITCILGRTSMVHIIHNGLAFILDGGALLVVTSRLSTSSFSLITIVVAAFSRYDTHNTSRGIVHIYIRANPV